MRIAVLTSLYPSAVRPHEGIFAERRWLGMRGRGHRVRVVRPLPRAPWPISALPAYRDVAAVGAREERQGIPIESPRYVHLPRAAPGNAERFAACGERALFAGDPADVVVCDYAWPAAAIAPRLARRATPCVISGRGSDVIQVAASAKLRELLAAALRSAGHWCAVSRDLVDRMDELAGSPGQGVLVANGVDGELFVPRERDQARRELGFAAGGDLVLVVGHWIARKDPLLALASFDELLKGGTRSARLAFVGRGPLEGALRAEIARRGLTAVVDLVGECSPERLARWYAAANVLLLTSEREGRPNVVLEALSCGLPVVATRAGGTGELLEGLDGALCDTRDPQEIARRLDRALATRFDRSSLRKRVEPLSWNASLDALEGCLAAAIAGAGARR